MASVFKRGRWVDATGRKCVKSSPGARYVESRFYSVQYVLDGRTKVVKGYTDRQATEQLAAKLERAKAQRAEGLEDPYKVHRKRPLAEHVADWITELKQVGRDDVYVRACEARLTRLARECGWTTLGAINLESFLRWRQAATSTIGTSAKPGANVRPMSAKTRNHYLAAARSFCRWAVRRRRTDAQPLADVSPVETAGQLRRERRSLTEEEVTRLLAAVPPRHQLGYRLTLLTGLRRDELRQLRWGDVRVDSATPSLQLRAETTKGKRADLLPLRRDVADQLRAARGGAEENERVLKSMASMESHKRYLSQAGIPFKDGLGRRVDFHALRHTFGSMLAKAGIAPRVAMSLMRHTDMRLTMNVYTDAGVLDLSGAVDSLPHVDRPAGAPSPSPAALGTPAGRSESVSSRSAGTGGSTAGNGSIDGVTEAAVTQRLDGDWQQKTPSGRDGVAERAMGFEPTTSSLGNSPVRTSPVPDGSIFADSQGFSVAVVYQCSLLTVPQIE